MLGRLLGRRRDAPVAAPEPEPASAPAPSAAPASTEGTEVLSIVHEGDLRLGELQLTSFDRHCDLAGLTRFTVVNNGGREVRTALEQHATTLSPAFRERLRILDAAQLSKSRLHGWRGQQVIKLIFALKVTTPHYVVLDAKNHLLRPTSLESLFDDRGRAVTVRRPPTPLLKPLLDASLAAFDVRQAETHSRAMPTVTPYVFDTAVVREMIREVKTRSGRNFTAAFRTTYRETTEFYLYYAWLLHRYGTVEQHHHYGQDFFLTIFTTWPQEAELFRRTLQRAAEDPAITFFGVHAKRLPRLDEPSRAAIAALWEEAGLLEQHPAEYYLTPTRPPAKPGQADASAVARDEGAQRA